jgi:hypothetical protein
MYIAQNGGLHLKFKKLPKVNNHPMVKMGENSPNLVTLLTKGGSPFSKETKKNLIEAISS